MKYKVITILLALGLSSLNASNPSQDEVRSAMKECFESAKNSDNERPDMTKVDECMSAKGFKKPEGQPKNGERPPMSPSSNN
jgi:hypothetical protein